MITDRKIIDGVLAEFMPLCAVPHGSGNERALSDYLAGRLTALGAQVKRDAAWSIWADVPASDGRGQEEIVALQAHMDMVCAAGAPDYRPHIDPIVAAERDGWLSTGGRSSLGADCGAGVALILWLLGQEISHPPLRIIFTVQEEIGLIGAQEIPAESVKNVSVLINLDGFALDRILVGAAGGTREHYARRIETAPAPNGTAYELSLSGFLGGHSGFDIDKKRANAILVMGEILRSLQTKMPFALAAFGGGETFNAFLGGHSGFDIDKKRANAILVMGEILRSLQTKMPFALAAFGGGETFNAIPYRCTACIVCEKPAEDLLRMLADEAIARYRQAAPDAEMKITVCSCPQKVWGSEVTAGLLTLLGGFADGVYAMHPELAGTVRDSSNLGHIYEENGEICLDAMIRFMDQDAEYALHQSHMLIAAMCGFAGAVRTRYPAWPVKRNSILVKRMSELYRKETGSDAHVIAQHVGLEPSFFLQKNPKMDCVGMGMEIADCHSPDERWKLDSIPVLARILCSYLESSI